MSFNEPVPVTGKYAKPQELTEHLLIIWPVGYKPHIQTVNTIAGKPSDGVVVDLVDLSAPGPDGKPGEVYRNQSLMQSRIIVALRPHIGADPVLGTFRKGAGTPGRQAPWEFISLTDQPEAVAQAQAWIDAHPDFKPTTKEIAETERPAPPPQPQFQNQGWPQGSVPAMAPQFQNQGPPPQWAQAPQQPQQWAPQQPQWQPPQQPPQAPPQQWGQTQVPQQWGQPTQQWTPPTAPSQPAQPQQWAPQQQPQAQPPMPPMPPQPASAEQMTILQRLAAQQGTYPQQGQAPSQPEQQQYGY